MEFDLRPGILLQNFSNYEVSEKIEAQRFGLLITPRCECTCRPPIGYSIFGGSTLENGDFLYFYINFDTNVSQRDKEHPKIAKKKRVKNGNFDQINHSYF